MIPRNRLDIGWPDLWFALRKCLWPASEGTLAQHIEQQWSPGQGSLACLSVRSGFDALLSALDLPRGSEILVSAVTIRDMVRIIEGHGLVAIPIDLDMQRLEMSAERLAAAVTPRSKAILAAHLFGSRMPLEPILSVARRHQLLVIEDCAQAYAGDSFRGHDESDVTMFSFGTIKTATALGGGILRFRDANLRNLVRARQAAWPRQSRWQFAARAIKAMLLQLLARRLVFTAFCTLCRMLRLNHDQIISRSVRGFAGGDLLAKIRRRPSAPLARRIDRPNSASVARRRALARRILARLPRLDHVGAAAVNHTHWVLPILSAAPDDLVRYLWSRGFDATRGASSLTVVPPPTGRPLAAQSEAALAQTLYLPVDPHMSAGDVDRLVNAIEDWMRKLATPCLDALPRMGPSADIRPGISASRPIPAENR